MAIWRGAWPTLHLVPCPCGQPCPLDLKGLEHSLLADLGWPPEPQLPQAHSGHLW
jgi:hypothetical protein